MKRKTVFSLIILILVILCMCLIFYFSSQDSNLSNNVSYGFTEKIAEMIFLNFKYMSSEFQNSIIFELNLFIRKAAHFSVYFLLSTFVYAELVVLSKKYILSGIASILLCMIYAVLDEFHQSFTPERTPLIKDVFIDTCGAALGVIFGFFIIAVIYFIRHIRRKNSSSQPFPS